MQSSQEAPQTFSSICREKDVNLGLNLKILFLDSTAVGPGASKELIKYDFSKHVLSVRNISMYRLTHFSPKMPGEVYIVLSYPSYPHNNPMI